MNISLIIYDNNEIIINKKKLLENINYLKNKYNFEILWILDEKEDNIKNTILQKYIKNYNLNIKYFSNNTTIGIEKTIKKYIDYCNNDIKIKINVKDILTDYIIKNYKNFKKINEVYVYKLCKISIVMAYYNRKQQLINTLNDFEKKYKNYNYEVVIVDDNSNIQNKLNDIINKYEINIKLIEITEKEKGNRVNPCIPYNIGFKKASGDIIIIQNPECYHINDILDYTYRNLFENDYLTFSCFTANSNNITNLIIENKNPISLIKNKDFLNLNKKYSETNYCNNMNWYNHPIERPVGYHFCSAIYKTKLDIIGGFDERFADGISYDDDELLLSIKYKLNLNMYIVDSNLCFVVHQWHEREQFKLKNKEELVIKNKILYENIKDQYIINNYNNNLEISNDKLQLINNKSEIISFNKTLHLYWDKSNFSYLNLLTVLSFNKYHKDWKIKVYIPNIITNIKTWKTEEQKIEYNGENYFDDLYKIKNVEIINIDYNKLNFYNEASEVIKSDYFRYHILYNEGGVWSDFDIIYIKNIENLVLSNNNIIFKCFDTQSIYYPIGFISSNKQSKLLYYLLLNCKKFYNKDYYQCIGANMLNKLFKIENNETYNILLNIDKNTKILNNEYYLPYQWNNINMLLDSNKDYSKITKNTFGIHWFNGSNDIKKYCNNLDLNNINKKSNTCILDEYIKLYLKSND